MTSAVFAARAATFSSRVTRLFSSCGPSRTGRYGFGDSGLRIERVLDDGLISGIAGDSAKFYGAVCNGAGRRIRTDDLLITNQLLYQLSYAGISIGK